MRDSRESRPTPAKVETAGISAGDLDNHSVATATDPHCCGALTLDELATAVRFSIHCGVDRCARTVLRGKHR